MSSPEPNPLQKAEFARADLDCGRAEVALGWLQGSWGPHEGERRGLLARSLERLGRLGEGASIRRQNFERSLSVTDLHYWLDDLPVPDQPAAVAQARKLALERGPTSRHSSRMPRSWRRCVRCTRARRGSGSA